MSSQMAGPVARGSLAKSPPISASDESHRKSIDSIYRTVEMATIGLNLFHLTMIAQKYGFSPPASLSAPWSGATS
ncbi:MAG: hypothetical protein ACR2OE_15505 [Thermomicrobiales bacterium]